MHILVHFITLLHTFENIWTLSHSFPFVCITVNAFEYFCTLSNPFFLQFLHAFTKKCVSKFQNSFITLSPFFYLFFTLPSHPSSQLCTKKFVLNCQNSFTTLSPFFYLFFILPSHPISQLFSFSPLFAIFCIPITISTLSTFSYEFFKCLLTSIYSTIHMYIDWKMELSNSSVTEDWKGMLYLVTKKKSWKIILYLLYEFATHLLININRNLVWTFCA